MKRVILSLCLAAMVCAAPALAAAPQPTSKIDISKMGGRWYEIARFYNHRQKDCFAAAADWVRTGDGFSVTNTCRQGAVTGPVKTVKASAKVVDPATNAKVKMTFMGLIAQEYWILDRAPDQSWFILATPGGNFIWLFAREAQMSAAAKSAAVARIKQLGYDTGKLQFTPH
ncbi:lipocalin family protein [Phenylobacterium sp.]|jgi:apolipoprotein D and lipocalin family protein|uniref:lipocalin family protein n=1 Tax=Phenylobacterium sp. TaxID=1871053 RepID=UPI002E319C0D|nr:lipocalin family protein [Phenylobacterium sp.]HEX2559351.1 lipocalin family protein [Phenylobacterium sp.]